MIQGRLTSTFIKSTFLLFAMSLLFTGCSYNTQNPPQTSIPALPEVTRPGPVLRSAPVQPEKPAEVQSSVAKVQKYSDTPKSPVVTQREVQAVLRSNEESKPAKQIKSEPSPFDDIPGGSGNSGNESSPAVKSLVLRARADMMVGNEQSAISKLERALRIEPENADLWYTLAQAHQSLSDDFQAITMAKKAISLAGSNDELIGKSWELIKTSGEKSGDTTVVKEAINYSKLNP